MGYVFSNNDIEIYYNMIIVGFFCPYRKYVNPKHFQDRNIDGLYIHHADITFFFLYDNQFSDDQNIYAFEIRTQ